MTAPAPANPPRWWRYLKKRRILCPHNHHLPHKFETNESGFVRCCHRMSKTTECGAWLYLFAIRGGGCIAVEVSLDEMGEMQELDTPTAVLEYLQIFP